ncbi:glycosyltransferase family 4 protein [Litorilinea aerophila]|uniref:Glycosyltransferase family 4 protein n=1 Tax=Litorilinea aerophila TaxID=1204385 RepID=A0A540VL31_9CHLR|nr:glycosyltransferase family 4 protein [Litorilinea aerophila]MCC9075701.1 glycosyltransferase family 4 protein [Litorilinea aerophila]
MRILHVTQRYLPAVGGAELYLEGVSKRLAADGHDVTVVTTDAWDFELFWNPDARRIPQPEAIIDGVRVLRFPVRHLPLSHWSYPAMRRLLWILASVSAIPSPWLHRLARYTPWTPELFRWFATTQERFDLVAGMTIVFEPLIAAAQQFAWQNQKPFVIYPLTHLGVGQEPGQDPVSRFYTMRHQVELVLNSAFLLAINADEANFYRQRGLSPDRIAVVGPGVNLAELQGGNGSHLRQRYGLKGPIVGMLSTMAYDKGTMHVIEAIRTLWQKGVNVHLILAGSVLEQFRHYWDNLPTTERQRIILLGAIDHQTKLDLLDAIDILVLPSRTDSFGIVFLEAWTYAKPVIAAQAWGVRTVVDHGRDGLLIPFGDVQALAEAIQTLIENPQLRRQMGEAGRHKVLHQHTWDHKYPRIREIYGALAHRGTSTI